MAAYREHVSTSGVCGIVYGSVACLLCGFTIEQGLLAGILTWMSGMLPDVDSQTGKPVQKIFGVLAAAVPIMMMGQFETIASNREQVILLAICTYTAIRYGVAHVLGKLSVHRGMFHSIPALFIASELTMLCYQSESLLVKGLMGGAVALGFLSHLILDELYSVEFTGVRLRLNKAAGSAMKFVGKRFMPNVFTYSLLMFLTYMTLIEFGLVEGPEDLSGTLRQAVETIDPRQ
jgi:membrane-bound metal-dependent hydrolase YbcI (DUF457 family)